MAPNPPTMRSWLYTAPHPTLATSLRLEPSVPFPFPSPPPPGHLIIRVHAASLNPADYKLASLPLVWRVMPRKPASPGMDFAGRVWAGGGAGGGVFAEGSRVFGRLAWPAQHGALGEFILVPSSCVAGLPDEVGYEQGACLGTAGMTALQSLRGVREGSKVLVNGASGGVGTFGVQIARILGAEVTGVCSGSNEGMVRELGAEVVDYKKVDVRQFVSGGQGRWDLVVDNVGTKGLLGACDGGVREGGKMVQVGAGLDVGAAVEMVRNALLPRWAGGAKTRWQFLMVKNDSEDLARLAEWTRQGKLRPVIDSVFGYEEAPKAFERLMTGRAKGNVVVSSSWS
ncbi:Zinc-type alcohol dehydrogenase-like protein [Sphaceloma murrayae]|uniref:Zinc-type alcohol dehydrogenase-like protein n=1 Tax=Sphaceloma murrayae TaxID=2082308 RepID=A0A2K1R254_9PEZI|nr:Zinc-type alcohol dehydrogenase-like protein [Sphaceloma murrayae]